MVSVSISGVGKVTAPTAGGQESGDVRQGEGAGHVMVTPHCYGQLSLTKAGLEQLLGEGRFTFNITFELTIVYQANKFPTTYYQFIGFYQALSFLQHNTSSLASTKP